jgi:RNA methyltransferase, TrmH family
MLNRSKFKYIQSLSHKKLRDEAGVFVAEGPKIIGELLHQKNVQLAEIYALQQWVDEMPLNALQNIASKLIIVEEQELERLSFLKTSNMVLAVFTQPVFEITTHNLVLMLDGVQDPGNLGTIIRTADWFGIKQIICSEDGADVYNAKVVQSTMGSIARVKVLYTNLENFLQSSKLPVYATVLHGTPVQQIEKIKEGIIVTGNESKGVRNGVLRKATHTITIPKLGAAESLNAAVATGIVLSHVVADK